MNPTLTTYRYPDTLVREYADWVVLLRPAQVTLGSLVLAATSDAAAFGALSTAAFAELGTVVADIERTLAAVFGYDRINYVMIMINDPNPHFHVIPRYAGPRAFAGRSFEDSGWPKPPDLGLKLDFSEAELESLKRQLISGWRGASPAQ